MSHLDKINVLRTRIHARSAVPAIAMAAHDPLSAKLVAEAGGLDAVWASGFELAASFVLPNISIVSPSTHLNIRRA
jgi:2-methylisocitrate lyase-like PEP mutase family enzyme